MSRLSADDKQRTTEHEDRARIRETEFAITLKVLEMEKIVLKKFKFNYGIFSVTKFAFAFWLKKHPARCSINSVVLNYISSCQLLPKGEGSRITRPNGLIGKEP